jgi:hypothetical protein
MPRKVSATPPAASKVPVTMRALLQRINRNLAGQNEVVKAARGEQARAELGSFYRVDLDASAVNEKHVDPEKLARKLGVLHPWEQLGNEE